MYYLYVFSTDFILKFQHAEIQSITAISFPRRTVLEHTKHGQGQIVPHIADTVMVCLASYLFFRYLKESI